MVLFKVLLPFGPLYLKGTFFKVLMYLFFCRIINIQAGICKVAESLLTIFPWASRIPNDEYYVKCRLDGKIFSCRKGATGLSQHEDYDIHINAQAVF